MCAITPRSSRHFDHRAAFALLSLRSLPKRWTGLLAPLFFMAGGAVAQPFLYPGQGTVQEVFTYPKEIAANREIMLVYDENVAGEFGTRQKYFDVNIYTNLAPNNDLQLQASGPVYQGPVHAGGRQLAVGVGDLDGDGAMDHIVATVGADQSIQLRTYNALPFVAPMQVVQGGSGSDPGPVHVGGSGESNGILKLRCGDLDGDGDDEVVLLYRRSDSGLLRINVFEVSGTMNLTSIGSIQDEAWAPANFGPDPFESFDLAVTDFDHDGKAEIMLAASDNQGGTRAPFLKLYAVEMAGGSATLVPRDKVFAPSIVPSNEAMPLAITTGDFNNDLIMEVALVFGYQNIEEPDEDDTFLRLFRVGDDLSTDPDNPDWLERIVDTGSQHGLSANIDGLSTLNLDAGDVMDSGRDALVLATNNTVHALTIDDNFNFSAVNGISIPPNDPGMRYDQYMAVCDMNNDGTAEVVNVRNYVNYDEFPNMEYIAITVHGWSGNSFVQLVSSNQQLGHEYMGSLRRFAMVAGDFDGDGVRFGALDNYQVADVVQPIMILNAHPIHSDDAGPGGWVDVNNVFGPPTLCDPWQASFAQASTSTVTVETTVSNTWGISATVGAGYEGLVGSISASLTSSYGEGFSNTNTSTETYNVLSTHDICYDDAIYASVTTYSVFEYPIYANDTLVCYVMAIHPDSTYFTWLESKDVSARDYAPLHEVGNILSYRRMGSSSVPASNILTEHQFTMGQNSSGSWTVTSGSLSGTSTETSRNVGFGASMEASVYGFSMGVSGSYDMSTVSTHRLTVGQEIAVSTNHGPLGNNASTMGYTTRPYLIWGHGGGIALDYEVLPTGSFFDLYDTQDPALNLPWRLETERGLPLPDPAERLRSKSFFLSERNPLPGDTIQVKLRVYNYSNSATDGPVEVSFYLGHPDHGGILQQDLDGNAVFGTGLPVPAQGFRTVTLDWATPADSSVVGRLYAKLDPGEEMTEVHEHNNIGFVSLGAWYPNQVGVEELSAPRTGTLSCYPNPASNHATVVVELDRPAELSVDLLDVNGKLVRSLPGRSYGSGLARIGLDLQGVAPGLYAVQVSGDQHRYTGRLMVQ